MTNDIPKVFIKQFTLPDRPGEPVKNPMLITDRIKFRSNHLQHELIGQ